MMVAASQTLSAAAREREPTTANNAAEILET